MKKTKIYIFFFVIGLVLLFMDFSGIYDRYQIYSYLHKINGISIVSIEGDFDEGYEVSLSIKNAGSISFGGGTLDSMSAKDAIWINSIDRKEIILVSCRNGERAIARSLYINDEFFSGKLASFNIKNILTIYPIIKSETSSLPGCPDFVFRKNEEYRTYICMAEEGQEYVRIFENSPCNNSIK